MIQLKQILKRLSTAILTSVPILLVLTNISVSAYPSSFSPGVIIDDSDFYTLPSVFNGKSRSQSIAIIQSILSYDNSILSQKQFVVSLDNTFVTNNPETAPYAGNTYSAAELIWMISRENLGKGKWAGAPITESINPLFIISTIQKESGLVYGSCAVSTCYSQSVQYRLDRATGYGCPDGSSCADWALGFFNQIYFFTRFMKAYMKGCAIGFTTWNNGSSSWLAGRETGKTVTIDGAPIYLQTNMACASYIYTPHNVYNTFYLVMGKIINISQNITPLQVESSASTSSITASSSNQVSLSNSTQSIASSSSSISATSQSVAIQSAISHPAVTNDYQPGPKRGTVEQVESSQIKPVVVKPVTTILPSSSSSKPIIVNKTDNDLSINLANSKINTTLEDTSKSISFSVSENTIDNTNLGTGTKISTILESILKQ